MHVAHGGGRVEFDHVVAVGNGVDGVFRRAVEAEVFGREVAVDREVGAGERGGAEGAAAMRLKRSEKRVKSRSSIQKKAIIQCEKRIGWPVCMCV